MVYEKTAAFTLSSRAKRSDVEGSLTTSEGRLHQSHIIAIILYIVKCRCTILPEAASCLSLVPSAHINTAGVFTPAVFASRLMS